MPTQSAHSIQITTTFANSDPKGQKLQAKTIVFSFLPDSFRVPVKSQFDRKPISMSASQFLLYKYTETPTIAFSVRVVAGLDDFKVEGGTVSSEPVNSPNHLTRMRTFARELYSLALPERTSPFPGTAPPKSVLTVGAMFKGVGVFDGVDIEFFGPYDEFGRPQEMEVNFSFLPSQFYDPVGQNQTGIDLTSRSGDSQAGNASLFDRLASDPSAVQMALNEQADYPFTIYYGGQ